MRGASGSPGRGVVLVHDVVNDFINGDPDPDLPSVLQNVHTLVNAAREAAVPVIFIGPGRGDPDIPPQPTAPGRLVWGGPGVEVPAMLDPQPTDTIIRKPRWGAFYGSFLTEHLRTIGRDTVIVCGLSLAGGVETTVRDAYNRDLHSVVVVDACLCRAIPDAGYGFVSKEEVAKVTLSILAQQAQRELGRRFASVVTTAEMCGMLEQFA